MSQRQSFFIEETISFKCSVFLISHCRKSFILCAICGNRCACKHEQKVSAQIKFPDFDPIPILKCSNQPAHALNLYLIAIE